jgi:hypothetical protein
MKNILQKLLIFMLSFSRVFALSQEETAKIAEKAYVYAYPLVLMSLTKEIMTNVEQIDDSINHAPVNQFTHARSFPNPSNKDVIRLNLDTLYSTAWLDLKKEPIILSIPDSDNKYYLIPLLDIWTDIFSSIGKRTTGTKAGNFAIVAPHWQGKLPKDVKEIKAPTDTIWIIGRTQTNGEEDYDSVHKFQKGLRLVPLSAWGKKDYKAPKGVINPSIDMKTPPPQQIAKMDGISFFKLFSQLLRTQRPHESDREILAEISKIGIVLGKDFDEKKLNKEQLEIIKNIPKVAEAKIAGKFAQSSETINGWSLPKPPIGTYNNDYLARASTALFGLGANLIDDALYFYALVDAKNRKLSGENKYILHFTQNQLPPAKAFWSLTLYDPKGYLTPNSINRFSLGDRDKLRFNQDGSLDIYIQYQNPGKSKESNWLPAPKGEFNILLRIYWPQEGALTSWVPPAISSYL